ncbi:MAG: PduL/EutD family phosphate acyltransferase [Christensenellaceae bacterium]|jgi:putative phosphotransacetylase
MEKTFLVEVSARHVHLAKEDVETLFGEGAMLTYVRDLSQPGQFVCEERVDIVGPKRTIANVVVLGPERAQSQAEVSVTDTFALGVNAPIRESGDLVESAPIILRGPKGEVSLSEGLIVAKRHIHMTPEDAAELNVEDKEIVWVKVDTKRPVVFGDCVVRVSPSYALAMHLDTDEANAAMIGREGFQGSIIKEL